MMKTYYDENTVNKKNSLNDHISLKYKIYNVFQGSFQNGLGVKKAEKELAGPWDSPTLGGDGPGKWEGKGRTARTVGRGHNPGGGVKGVLGAGPYTGGKAKVFSPTAYERLALLLGGLALLGVGGNLLVLLLYSKFPWLRTPTHLFLVNLSLGDLLVSLFGVTFTFASCLRNGWVWDAVGCAWDGFSGSLFEKSSSLKCLCDA
nr:opsin-3 [Peromyscus maniculatus bairdii]